MAKTAIDFKFIKAEADFLAVLEHYDLTLQGKGVQREALCPFHPDKRPSLKVNLGRKVFHPGFPRWLGFWLTSRPAFGRKLRTLRGERWLLLLSPVTSDVVRSPMSG